MRDIRQAGGPGICLDIAISRGWRGRGDAECQPDACLADFRPAHCQRSECAHVLDPVVGGHDQQDVIRVAGKGGKINRRRGIAAGFLKNVMRF